MKLSQWGCFQVFEFSGIGPNAVPARALFQLDIAPPHQTHRLVATRAQIPGLTLNHSLVSGRWTAE
ncbi:MAG: hypothetical protein N3A53_07750 [Verrucomicrobiae bacterium]|nr:hypothetical protein [Verrucomicrobiae bacterium]